MKIAVDDETGSNLLEGFTPGTTDEEEDDSGNEISASTDLPSP